MMEMGKIDIAVIEAARWGKGRSAVQGTSSGSSGTPDRLAASTTVCNNW